jgi:hypothetical protein
MIGSMSRILVPLALAALTCIAQDPKLSRLAVVLNFEAEPSGDMPGGWRGGPPGTIFADDKVVHSGKWSARIERNAESLQGFSTITNLSQWISVDYGVAGCAPW